MSPFAPGTKNVLKTFFKVFKDFYSYKTSRNLLTIRDIECDTNETGRRHKIIHGCGEIKIKIVQMLQFQSTHKRSEYYITFRWKKNFCSENVQQCVHILVTTIVFYWRWLLSEASCNSLWPYVYYLCNTSAHLKCKMDDWYHYWKHIVEFG